MTSPTSASICNVEEIPSNASSRRNSLNNDDNSLDYALNENGSCTCKLCGEIVSSRTHWYRHKYKVHNVALFRCDKCEIFFKSKKGYEGHLANKHAPKMVGTDGKPKTKKEVEGLNKVLSWKMTQNYIWTFLILSFFNNFWTFKLTCLVALFENYSECRT